MKELEYPFDAAWILSNRRKIRKSLLEENRIYIEKNVAVLGGSTTANIVQILDLFLMNHGIKASFYESEYGMFYEDAVFGNQKLSAFQPDIIYIHTTNRNVLEVPTMLDSVETIDALLESHIHRFETVWQKLYERYACPIIQNNFEMPLFRLLGNRDAVDKHGTVNFLSRMNQRFYDYAENHVDFFICDINYISADYGLKEWSSPFYWNMYKCALNVNAIPYLSFNVANIIKSIFGKNKKGLVLDLDNTLWGGVVGDDGVENIKIGPETPSGQVYLEFQEYIKRLKQIGVILNINSKNDASNALAGLRHPDSVLSPEDFIEIRANWESKDRNMFAIAEAIHLLPESLVFVDDNPAERHIVKEQIPGVCTPEIGESYEYIQNIDRNGFFEVTYVSVDDMKRNEMYKENAERAKLQGSFSDYGEYLHSLNMRAVIKPFEPIYMERIAQLTNKSNQFNLTTKRYTQAEIEEVSNNEKFITLYGKLEDKFGDNGVVSVCIGRIDGNVCHMDLWLMSCRVLKRDMEFAMMDSLVCRCKAAGIVEIRGYYYPTQKNSMVKQFYETIGFEFVSELSEGTVWSFKVKDPYMRQNKYIQVEVEV
ncbi:MAG: HAD-IIIC family phosphatase [Dorea sp.]|nr:HAD-IIIC family phosphatase [Dorea sp.]